MVLFILTIGYFAKLYKMIKFEDLKFMSIGSNCAPILFLGKDRIRGPIDNMAITDAYAIKFLISSLSKNLLPPKILYGIL